MSITQSYWRITNSEFNFLQNRCNKAFDDININSSLMNTLEGLLFYYNNQEYVISLINKFESEDELDGVIETEILSYRHEQERNKKYLDIYKEWEILHFLLTGESMPSKANSQLTLLSKFIMGSDVLNIPATYDYVRYLLPEEIKEIIDELGKIDETDLKILHKDKFVPEQELYANSSPMFFDDEDWNYIFRIYDELVMFFQLAEDENEIILISFD